MKRHALTAGTLLAMMSLMAAACAPPAPEVVEVTRLVVRREEVTREVVKEVDVITAVEVEKEPDQVAIVMWTTEGVADGGLQFVQSLADAYSAEHPNVMFEITNKDPDKLREDFLTTTSTGAMPDLLWTVNDDVEPFTDAQLILATDDLVNLDKYVGSALAALRLSGNTWGVPIANGNHLMLLYNRALMEEAPFTTDELIEKGLELTTGDRYGLAFNQDHPFWLVPWLGGFRGSVFASDGKTPTLDTPEMVATLQFLHDIKYDTPLVPVDSNYDRADALFKEGKAAMLINGDWSLDGYQNALGGMLGVARIPTVSATGEWPRPYLSGVSFMLPVGLKGAAEAKMEAVKGYIKFVTNPVNQIFMVAKLGRLPALVAALDDPLIANDPILNGSADQMQLGIPMPAVSEMRCNWDAMRPEMRAVLADTKSPEEAAADMQTAAERCVAMLE